MRRQPVAFFLGDCAFLSDSKFRALARRLHDTDDFNSAVGAYFIALAAARRNGLPVIDVDLETGSRFVPDLRAVGLFTDEGFPETSFREWAPSRPPRPSEAASNASKVSNESKLSQTSSDVGSSPLPSFPFSSKTTREGGPGGGDIVLAYMRLTGMGRPSEFARKKLEAGADRYGFDEWLACINLARELSGNRNDIRNAEAIAEERLIARQAEERDRHAAELRAMRVTPERAEENRRRVNEEIAKAMRRGAA